MRQKVIANPFNPSTSIHYDIATAGTVEIRIYDVAGRLVREMVNETKVPGRYRVQWTGIDSHDSPVASGIYFVRMIAGGERFTKKMLLLK